MKRLFTWAMLAISLAVFASLATAQTVQTTPDRETKRNDTREKLRQLLGAARQRKDINMTFTQSTKQPYNFTSLIRDGLTNTESLEVVIGVTQDETIGFRIFPHYKGEYINIGRAKDSTGLMRKMLNLSDKNFLFWGADESGDAFAGYTFTLESGFPYEAIMIVLQSIRNTDQFVGQMRPFIDVPTTPEN